MSSVIIHLSFKQQSLRTTKHQLTPQILALAHRNSKPNLVHVLLIFIPARSMKVTKRTILYRRISTWYSTSPMHRVASRMTATNVVFSVAHRMQVSPIRKRKRYLVPYFRDIPPFNNNPSQIMDLF